jgi:hypothetical protein
MAGKAPKVRWDRRGSGPGAGVRQPGALWLPGFLAALLGVTGVAAAPAGAAQVPGPVVPRPAVARARSQEQLLPSLPAGLWVPGVPGHGQRTLPAAHRVTPLPVAGPAAPAGSSWQVQPTATPLVANGFLQSISCTSSVACTAVGYYKNVAGAEVTLAEAWNGTRWVLKATPNPAGATASELAAVSCTATDDCTAVGSYSSSTGAPLTLAEAWNGRSWTIQGTPEPAGSAGSGFFAVSCASAQVCIAAGDYKDSGGTAMTLAEAWNGTSWTIQATPNPAGATAAGLAGVSCASAQACAAAGSYTSSSGSLTLAEAWNGTTWSIQATPTPAGSTGAAFAAVSCSSPLACTAAGSYTSSSGSLTLAEAWNGTTWSIQATPSPGNMGNTIGGVSCSSPAACTMAGSYQANYETYSLAERWNGASWSVQSTPSPSGDDTAAFAAVSCASASGCVAAGSNGRSQTLVAAWNGTRWALQATPNGSEASSYTQFFAVSCRPAGTCAAVGFDGNTDYDFTTLAEVRNRESWRFTPTSNPHLQYPQNGAYSGYLYGVSCPSPRACFAVGWFQNPIEVPFSEGSVAEAWNGKQWRLLAPPGTGEGDHLVGVSCTSVRFCIAVGWSGGAQTLAEIWNGTSWSIQPTPNPPSASYLEGVSCTSARACTAVGWSQSGQTLAETWNGTSWSIQATPNPSGLNGSFLEGVSCASARACTAVGNSYVSSTGGMLTLAEAWNGTSWTIIQPLTGQSGELNGASCTSARACTAVGGTGSGASLVEAWNGTSWSIQATPEIGTLYGISCSPCGCTAVSQGEALATRP